MTGGLESVVKLSLERFVPRKSKLSIILDTPGGYVEVVDRIVGIIRHLYDEVSFIVPDRAMSAGTVFVMSGDRIYMDYFSCLGPIDPQVGKNGRLVPALAYLKKFEELNKKAASGGLTPAEYALISKLDLAEMYQFEQARELSIELLEQWLSLYKFKNWIKTRDHGMPVDDAMKKKRAKEIANALNDTGRWKSHGRGIPMSVLKSDEIKLEIDDMAPLPWYSALKDYCSILADYMRTRSFTVAVQTVNTIHTEQ